MEGGENGEAGRKNDGRKGKEMGSGTSTGRKAWMQGEGMRDETEQDMDIWLEGWAEKGVWVVASFLAQHFSVHITSTKFHPNQGSAFTHTPT